MPEQEFVDLGGGGARVKVGGLGWGEPGGKLTSIIAGMVADADSIVDLEVIRAGTPERKCRKKISKALCDVGDDSNSRHHHGGGCYFDVDVHSSP